MCFISFIRSYDFFIKSKLNCACIPILAIDRHNELTGSEKKWFYEVSRKYNFEILELEKNSNCLSYLEVFKLALNFHDDTAILFAEDDYLWRKDSIFELYFAINNLPADYITPYDHPVRYDNFFPEPDFIHWETKIFLSYHHHFRPQESTCMTYISTSKVLKEDKEIHKMFSGTNQKCPNDRELFRSLQHLGRHIDQKHKKRLLLGPLPSLATHAHLPYLAPVVDWHNEVKKVKRFKLTQCI